MPEVNGDVSLTRATAEATQNLQNHIQEISKSVDAEMSKGEKANFNKIMEQVTKVIVLLARLSGKIDKLETLDIRDKLEINIQEQSNTYGHGVVYLVAESSLELLSAGIGITSYHAAANGLAYFAQAIGKGKVTFNDEWYTKNRTLLTHLSDELKRLRTDLDQGAQRANQGVSEGYRSLQQVVNAIHEVVARLLQ